MKKCLMLFIVAILMSNLFAQKSADEYIDEINNFDKIIKALEIQKSTEKDKKNRELNTAKKRELTEIDNLEKGPREREEAFQERKENEKKDIEKKYKRKIEVEIASIETDYNSKIQDEESKQKLLLESLKSTTFTVLESDTQASIGDFVVESTPQYWPVTIKSVKNSLNFGYSEKFILSDDEPDAIYYKYNNNKETATAQIVYIVIPNEDHTNFEKKIKTIRLYIDIPEGENIKHEKVTEYSNLDLPENNKGYDKVKTEDKKTEIAKTPQKTATTQQKTTTSTPKYVYKDVWVDEKDLTSDAHVTWEILTWSLGAVSTGLGLSSGIAFWGVYGTDEFFSDGLYIAPTILLGAGLVTMFGVALPLSCTHKIEPGHYEKQRVRVSESQSNQSIAYLTIGVNSIGLSFKL